MKTAMRVIRNLLMAMFIMVGVVIIMPKSVWASTLSIDKGTMDVAKGGTNTLKITYTIATDEYVGYDFDDATAISISEGSRPAGLVAQTWTLTVTGLQKDGTSTITVGIYKTADDTLVGTQETCYVTVGSASGSLTVTTSGISAGALSGERFTVNAVGAGGHTLAAPITWDIEGASAGDLYISTSSDSATETVEVNLSALPISATIKATDDDGVTGQVNISISKINASSITVKDTYNRSSGDFDIGDIEYLTAVPDPDVSGLGLTWTSSNAGVVKVTKDSSDDRDAEIEAVGCGTATITVRTTNGKTATYTAIVRNKPDIITITATPASAKEAVGKSDITLKAVAKASNGKAVYPALTSADFLWSSSDDTIAKCVTTQGDTIKVKGIDVGTATITVALPALSLSEDITVEIVDVEPVTKFTLPTQVYVTKGKSVKVSPISILPNNATNRAVTSWLFDGTTGTGITKNDAKSTTSYAMITASSSATGYATVEGEIANGAATGTPYVSDNITKVVVMDLPKSESYSKDNRTWKVSLPTGVGSDSTSFDVNGYLLEVMDGSTSLASVKVKKESGLDSFTIDSSTLENVVSKVSSGLSGSSDSIKFRVTPINYDNDYKATDVYAESDSVTVYKVTTKAGTGVSSTSPSSVWALPGQTVSISASLKSGYSGVTWDPSDAVTDKSSTSTTLKVSTTTSQNTVTATSSTSSSSSSSSGSNSSKSSASGSSSGSSSGYDKVPKTGEGNGLWAMWVILAALILGAGGIMVVMLRKSK